MIKNIFGVLFMILFVTVFMAIIIKLDGSESKVNLNGTETETHWYANDGEYVPIYRIRSAAIRLENTVEVDLNGNSYSCYVSPESEIQTGDIITAVFYCYNGNYELIDIAR